jgi:hypothetical protein
MLFCPSSIHFLFDKMCASASGVIEMTVRSLKVTDCPRGGLERLYVRGWRNVHKKLLIQAAACNLALLMRALNGAGNPERRTTAGSNSFLRFCCGIRYSRRAARNQRACYRVRTQAHTDRAVVTKNLLPRKR